MKKAANSKKGFTLVEMLVVIAIIAILVSILIPTVMGAVTKAKAATDAANLRAVLSVLEISVLDGDKSFAGSAASAMAPECKSFKGAECYAAFFEEDMYIEVYYVKDGSTYGVDYFSEVASSGESTKKTTLSALQTSAGTDNVIKLKQGDAE